METEVRGEDGCQDGFEEFQPFALATPVIVLIEFRGEGLTVPLFNTVILQSLLFEWGTGRLFGQEVGLCWGQAGELVPGRGFVVGGSEGFRTGCQRGIAGGWLRPGVGQGHGRRMVHCLNPFLILLIVSG